MFNSFTPYLSQMNLPSLVSQITPEQSAQLRSFIVDSLLEEKTFNLHNPFFTAIQKDKKEEFTILKEEIIQKIKSLPDTHPAKQLVFK